MALLFKEVLRVKRSNGSSSVSVRECLFASIAEYNKNYCSSKAGVWKIYVGIWMIADNLYTVIKYNRCPRMFNVQHDSQTI